MGVEELVTEGWAANAQLDALADRSAVLLATIHAALAEAEPAIRELYELSATADAAMARLEDVKRRLDALEG